MISLPRDKQKPFLIKLKIWFLNRECLGIWKIFLLLCLLCLLPAPHRPHRPRDPAQAELINHTYWTYIHNPLFTTGILDNRLMELILIIKMSQSN